VRVSLKAVPGVDTVNVSLEKGLASVTLKPGNSATLKQLGDAIGKNGFTMKKAEATIDGQLVQASGKWKLQVSGSNEVLDLLPAANAPAIPASLAGKTVEVTGTIAEAAKGKIPDSMQYQTVTEKK
jgi:copper chaperone CopZ